MTPLNFSHALLPRYSFLPILSTLFVFVFLFPVLVSSQTVAEGEALEEGAETVIIEGETGTESDEIVVVLDDDEPNGQTEIEVLVLATGLLDGVDEVLATCRLYSKLTGNGIGEQVATARLVFTREDTGGEQIEGEDGVTYRRFRGNAIEDSVEIPFVQIEGASPHELWTNGACNLLILGNNHIGDPRRCGGEQIAEAITGNSSILPLNCVWPTANPEDGSVEFERPGLEGFDATTGLATGSPEE